MVEHPELKNALRKHWNSLKFEDSYKTVYEFLCGILAREEARTKKIISHEKPVMVTSIKEAFNCEYCKD
jgi:hypothetical protein